MSSSFSRNPSGAIPIVGTVRREYTVTAKNDVARTPISLQVITAKSHDLRSDLVESRTKWT